MNLRELLVVGALAFQGVTAAAQSTAAQPALPAQPAQPAQPALPAQSAQPAQPAQSAQSAIPPLDVSTGGTRSDSQAIRGVNAVPLGVALVSAVPAGVTSSDALRLASIARLEIVDTVPRRRAVAFSDWYSRRLTVHRYGSYAMLPLFVTQFVLGNKLLNQKEDQQTGQRVVPVDKGLRTTHAVVAGAVGTLFVVNTTTGLWNLIESRHTEDGRTRRTIHAITMLAADAGFAYTGYLGSNATDRGPPQGRTHRNVALTSFGISTAGAALMWFGQRD